MLIDRSNAFMLHQQRYQFISNQKKQNGRGVQERFPERVINQRSISISVNERKKIDNAQNRADDHGAYSRF